MSSVLSYGLEMDATALTVLPDLLRVDSPRRKSINPLFALHAALLVYEVTNARCTQPGHGPSVIDRSCTHPA